MFVGRGNRPEELWPGETEVVESFCEVGLTVRKGSYPQRPFRGTLGSAVIRHSGCFSALVTEESSEESLGLTSPAVCLMVLARRPQD